MNHYLVVDLEATCSDDHSIARDQMEIIEIGAVMLSPTTRQPVSEYQAFIRPVRNPRLSEFCLELTSISQAQVDSAAGFSEIFAEFLAWANGYLPYTFCSWGNYDRNQFMSDCEHHQVDYPFERHINLKAEFANSQGRRKKMGVPAALKSMGLTFSGSHHRGIDDARNIACLIPYIFPPM